MNKLFHTVFQVMFQLLRSMVNWNIGTTYGTIKNYHLFPSSALYLLPFIYMEYMEYINIGYKGKGKIRVYIGGKYIYKYFTALLSVPVFQPRLLLEKFKIMATVPTNTKCSMLGCNNPRSKANTCCYSHGGVDYNKHPERREHNLMYKSPQWKKRRRVQLSMQPLCQACLLDNKVKGATVVDHVFPWSALGEDYFYHNLFQSLCTECHNRKTNMEQRGKIIYYSTHAISYTIHDAARVIGEC